MRKNAGYSDEELEAIWEMGHELLGEDPDEVREDDCGDEIHWEDYGDRDSEYGWEVDHIDPDEGGGLDNLRPLQWQNNVAKSNDPDWECF